MFTLAPQRPEVKSAEHPPVGCADRACGHAPTRPGS